MMGKHMKSPQDMRIIQIDITNACIHQCSNCTRFCGHHKKPFFMDFETFKKAVDSFEGFQGTVGIMGGEPTLHPQFKRFLEYLNEHKYFKKTENLLTKPTKNFMNVIAQMEQRDTYMKKYETGQQRCVDGYGLWSALSNNYRAYYELIQDTFNFQALNDHTNIMYHSPIMVRRKDLNIPDDEWIKTRDNCWAQGEWSATITPKGAFFCEIAGALDMLFDGPGGWPIEPGWWKRKPEDFGYQLQWCELCGITMSTFTRDANDEIDDMSQWYYDELKKMGSPKLERKGANVLKINECGEIAEESKADVKEVREFRYSESYFSRFNEKNDWLNPKGLVGALFGDDMGEVESYKKTIANTAKALTKIVFVTSNESIKEELSKNVFADNVIIDFSQMNEFGAKLNRVLSKAERGEYVALLGENIEVQDRAVEFFQSYVCNPGSILVAESDYDMECELGKGIELIISPEAFALEKASFPAVNKLKNKEELIALYDENKVISLKKDSFEDHAYKVEKDVKYAVYGAGPTGQEFLKLFDKDQIAFFSDSDCNKWGCDFNGYEVISPDDLVKRKDEFDKIFVASTWYFEIKTTLMELGFSNDIIVTTLMTM